MIDECAFCERKKELSFHHYIPKTLHNNKWFKKRYKKVYMRTHGVYLCEQCHKEIHIFFSEKDLGKYYNTKDKLFSTEKVKNFVNWIKNKN